jgi:hypothetical protein
MPHLAELQQSFSHAVLAGTVPALAFAPGRVSAAAALQVHRNTVMGALVNALRLSHPTVDALVGADFFDHVASLFAEAQPPKTARLSGYGEGFAAFLEAQVPLPYLGDVARLDWAIERALLAPAATRRFALEAHVALELPVSLAVLRLHHPAAEIRAAIGDDAALAAIDLLPAPRAVLIWRSGQGAVTRAISTVAADFLETLLAGRGADDALAAAGSEAALPVLLSEIFTASFCTIVQGDTP